MPPLSLDYVQRLAAAKHVLERVQQAQPDLRVSRMRLPIDQLRLERALVDNLPSVDALKEHGLSPRIFARDLSRLAMAQFAIAALDARNAARNRGNKAEPEPAGPHILVRLSTVTPTSDSSEWLWVPQRDVVFARQHHAALTSAGLSTKALGLEDQLQTADARAFPTSGGLILDSTEAPGTAAAGPPLRVLFLSDGGGLQDAGLAHNEAYRVFQHIAAGGLRRRVVVGHIVLAASTLKYIWNYPITRPIIRHLDWDYVVLQEHASAASREDIAIGPSLFEREVKAAGARLVYTIVGHATSFLPSVDRKEAALLAAARPVKPILAPMTAAWRAALATDPSINLESDYFGGGHLNTYGHYLQALVFYRAITGQSPIGLPVPPINDVKTKAFVIPQRDAEVLQRAAAAAFRPGALPLKVRPADSLGGGLSLANVKRLLKAKDALDSLQPVQSRPMRSALRLPIDQPALERAIAADARLASIVQRHGFSSCTYAREFIQLATAVFAVAAVDTIAKLQPERWPVDWYLKIRVKKATSDATAEWSDWLVVPAHDVGLAFQYQGVLKSLRGLSVATLGLTDQLRTAEAHLVHPLDASGFASPPPACVGAVLPPK